ncbi:MAG TPA: YhbY family RNA-binding protein [Gemmatimonadaceae bacterium]
MTITSRQRADLRAQAHHLSVTVHVGHQGVTDALKQTLEDAFANRELVKIQFSKNADVTPKQAANDLAALIGADVVQAIGRTATLFRAKPQTSN